MFMFVFLNGIISALMFALIAWFMGNSPVILGIIGFFSGALVAMIVDSVN